LETKRENRAMHEDVERKRTQGGRGSVAALVKKVKIEQEHRGDSKSGKRGRKCRRDAP